MRESNNEVKKLNGPTLVKEFDCLFEINNKIKKRIHNKIERRERFIYKLSKGGGWEVNLIKIWRL